MKLICFLLLGVALPVYGRVFETQVEQTSPQEGDFGEYRLWVPPGSHPSQILVVVWGSNQCSLGIVDDPAWQELAASINCALLASCYYPQAFDNHWDRAEDGSGAALLKAIRVLALISGESQLKDASLYLIGDSQGGQFAFSFASWQPARTLGFVSLKGGQHDIADIQNAVSVPGLFFAGELDAPFRIANIEEVFSKGRGLGSPWCLAVEPRGDHSPNRCGPLVRSFLQALSGRHPIREGRNLGLSAESDARQGAQAISARSWFPDAEFQHDWVKFKSGAFGFSSPPLGFESKTPPVQGTVTPAFQDLGSIESGEKTKPFSLEVTPSGATDWDGVSTPDCSYLSDVRIVKISPDQFTIYTRLNTTGLPLGRFTGVVPLRFNLQGKSVLGGVNVPLTAKVTGDVAATPPLILFNRPLSSDTESTLLKIESRSRRPITLVDYQALPGIKVTTSAEPSEPLDIVVSIDVQKGSAITSGSILLHLKTDKEWVLRIPYITTLRN